MYRLFPYRIEKYVMDSSCPSSRAKANVIKKIRGKHYLASLLARYMRKASVSDVNYRTWYKPTIQDVFNSERRLINGALGCYFDYCSRRASCEDDKSRFLATASIPESDFKYIFFGDGAVGDFVDADMLDFSIGKVDARYPSKKKITANEHRMALFIRELASKKETIQSAEICLMLLPLILLANGVIEDNNSFHLISAPLDLKNVHKFKSVEELFTPTDFYNTLASMFFRRAIVK